jgi:hypothetical protein
MRAREFIVEQHDLPPEQADPMRWTYVIPGLSSSNAYQNYRFGVAVARARADIVPDTVNPYKPEWSSETAFGEHGIVSGMNSGIKPVIDSALKMTKTPGGKKLVTSPNSDEPASTQKISPIQSFRGYPR